MTLAELSRIITALKTSATHLGVKHEDMLVTVNRDDAKIETINAHNDVEGAGSVVIIVEV
jgi:hypothetical protein